MKLEIAVFLNEDNKTIPCNVSGIVNVYIKDREQWNITKRISFDISNADDGNIIRKKFIYMVESLDKCKVFVAADVRGIFYSILESRGFNVWGIEGAPENFLEYVLKKEEQDSIEEISIENQEILTPVETGKQGNYYIDLRSIMKSNEKIHSRDILLPFLCENNFNELEVDCSHVPPWFKYELKNLNLYSSVEYINEDLFKVRIYHM
ncbi:Fe-only nitrogenase accessory protein AnfO [Clostridium sp.]|jgi:Fe-only nitrogenase accessory protein AnfO|uniref:Fe-only nitrogenase accessory protein AnfO n=1 Tax=Clostridium sp. TaxID=1506 RepID=UPI00258E5248|nr:Fe-only nitrogenase accessory protein AnfO [Clostridium sp.]MDF2504449.1 hypothetical protein [Clostridium sp.]